MVQYCDWFGKGNLRFNKYSLSEANVLLDLNKNDYLFALSSKRCDCSEQKAEGFEFHVSMSTFITHIACTRI